MHGPWTSLGWLLAALAAAYAILAAAAVAGARTRARAARSEGERARPPVTLLKPLCGEEFGLYEHLRSFCTQDYPLFQIVFGVQDGADGAVRVVRSLQQEFPALDIELVIDARRHGSNAKVSSLINMLPRARYQVLLFADSDIRVPPDYLSQVLAPLAEPDVGLVTCPYVGRARAGASSALGALFINDWFMPQVRVAALFGSQAFVSGATIALRREVLERSGGLAAIADQLADDFKLGEQVRALGLRVVLSGLRVDTVVDEPGFAAWWQHSLRGLRTIYSIQPWGYAFCFLTFSLPLALAGAALAHFDATALILLGITAAARLVLHFHLRRGGTRAERLQLVLLLPHDLLLLALWCWSFRNREVTWRQERFGIGRDGSLRRIGPLPRRASTGDVAK